jgi:predicted DCC family thiol-disulfide oxidoreductase YuxK
MDKPVIIFDGVCVLCSRLLNFILWLDQRKQRFSFATAQSNFGQKIFQENNLNTERLETVLLVLPNGKIYQKSDVIFEAIKILGSIWIALMIFKIIPKLWRDKFYDFVARSRYQWFGKSEYCARISQKYLDRIIR